MVGQVLVLAIFAMSLDLLVGFTGLVSFGHAAYFGIAAYAVAILRASDGRPACGTCCPPRSAWRPVRRLRDRALRAAHAGHSISSW